MKSLLRLTQWNNLNKVSILVRVDFNIDFTAPHAHTHPRFAKTVTTLRYLLHAGAHVLILSHKGRPHGILEKESLKPVIALLAQHNIDAVFATNIAHAATLIKKHTCVLLENLRFFEGESNTTKATADLFAQEIAACGTYFVQDAWASLHRTDSSIALIPRLFDTHHKSCGFIVQEELKKLDILTYNAQKPFVVIVGGGKGDEKIISLLKLCKNNPPTELILLPGLAPLQKNHPLKILCKKQNITLQEPLDYLCAHNTWDGPLTYKSATKLTHHDVCISLGPQSITLFLKSITKAKSLFLNGMMGDVTRPETTAAFSAMLQGITNAYAYSVIGGGDTLTALQNFTHIPAHVFCSTGGGATLAYLSHQPLPGLQALD